MSIKQHLSLARMLATLLDSRFSIFGFHFGLDPLFSLIPGIGTLVPTLLSLYLVWLGIVMHLPKIKLLQMILNVLIDGAIGSTPFVGFLADAVLKANVRNLAILENALAQRDPGEPIAVYKE